MRIAYYTCEDFRFPSGVARKIASQVRMWSLHDEQYCLFVPGLGGVGAEDVHPEFSDLNIVIYPFPPGSRKYFSTTSFGIKQILNWNPDIIYTRYSILPPSHYSLGKKVKRVFEVNSLPNEFSLYNGTLKCMYHRLTRGLMLRNAVGAVFVSNELASSFSHDFPMSVVIANGVNGPVINREHPREEGPPRVLFLANGDLPWHGVDKLAWLASQCHDFEFHVAGSVRNLSRASNLFLYGHLDSPELTELILKCDIGLSTLALHRKHQNEASALKVRDYIRHGLPFVLAFDDTDLESSTPNVLKIPNTESNVELYIDQIRRFAINSVGVRLDSTLFSHMLAEYKEMKRIDFFSKVMGSSTLLENPGFSHLKSMP